MKFLQPGPDLKRLSRFLSEFPPNRSDSSVNAGLSDGVDLLLRQRGYDRRDWGRRVEKT